jgi:hypothetical protein
LVHGKSEVSALCLFLFLLLSFLFSFGFGAGCQQQHPLIAAWVHSTVQALWFKAQYSQHQTLMLHGFVACAQQFASPNAC